MSMALTIVKLEKRKRGRRGEAQNLFTEGDS